MMLVGRLRVHVAHDGRASKVSYEMDLAFVAALLLIIARCAANAQSLSPAATSINTIVQDQLESLRLAQSYANVTGLLNQVAATANSSANQILGEFHGMSLV